MAATLNITSDKIKQFQQATGQPVSVAVAYLEAEEGDVSTAVEAYNGDVREAAIQIEDGTL